MLVAQILFRIFLITILLIAFIAQQPSLAGSRLRVHFVATEPCALLYFIDKLSGDNYPSVCLRQWLEQYHGQAARDKQVINRYRSLLNRSYQFSGELKQRRTFSEELEYLASQSTTVQRFLERVKPCLKPADYVCLQSIVHYFEPIYEFFVWQPNKDKLKAVVSELENSSSHISLADHLQQVMFLYGSNYPENVDLVIAMVILPKQKGINFGRDAHCNGSLELVEITPEQVATEKWGTIFHELCHSLWVSVPAVRQNILRDQFIAAGGLAAYSILDEAMATALGAGWFMAEVHNGVVDQFWYSDPQIKEYAHSLLPVVKRYLIVHKKLDKDFVLKATKLFANRFPN